MKYKLIQSNDGHNWNETGINGDWKEVWAWHQKLKGNGITYFVLTA